MKTVDLNGQWRMKALNQEDWIEAKVPGSVFQDLMAAGKVPDPYFRDNEDKIAPVFQEDYEYRREFSVAGDVLKHDEVLLCCEGLDTIATLSLNGRVLAQTDNMHRTWHFNVKGLLKEGVHPIEILFRSPVTFTQKMAAQSRGMSMMGGRGIEYIRKAQCMFGWDWGLVLPDSGIWRDIYIECFDLGKIEDVHIMQEHLQGEVLLNIQTACRFLREAGLEVEATVTSPDGETFSAKGPSDAGSGVNILPVKISDPKLWWPNGFGEQPLYRVDITLFCGGVAVDERHLQIGLRTVHLKREKDEWGQSFTFLVNGMPLFLKGANLVIEDALLGRTSRGRTEKMIKSCVQAHFNCIRVWGGAVYPADYFYDLCDQYGILVYHDLMFACNFYPTDTAFLENVKHELADNVGRARHHACIGLWSGNNEVEVIYGMCASKAPEFVQMRKQFGIPEMDENVAKEIWDNILKLFYEFIPKLMSGLDPQTDFVCSSPSSDEPGKVSIFNNFDNGDAHYYLAYDNQSPYTKMRDLKFRFVSEMGFQSYPDMKTVRSFTCEEDLAPYTPVMLKHQKCFNGNQIIEAYMGQDYKVPKRFEDYVYVSQMLAGEILRYSVEHLRRNEGRCMGVITWQLNDCWPVVSWAGLDYFGRWKAQQYYSKRAYAPILVSAKEEEASAELWITNDTPADVTGTVRWQLLDARSKLVREGSETVRVQSCKPVLAARLDFGDVLDDGSRGDYYLAFAFEVENQIVSEGTALFVKAKDFNFAPPEIETNVQEEKDRFMIGIRSAAFTKSVALFLSEANCIFSDNYFDLSAGTTKVITAPKADLSEPLSLDEFKRQLKTVCLYDIE